MKGKKKTPKVPGFMRSIVGANVKRLMDDRYTDPYRSKTRLLAKEAKISHSSVQRIIAGETGASLDNLEALASVFDLSAYQLLIPTLNIKNPQVVVGATKDEERMFREWKRRHPIKSEIA